MVDYIKTSTSIEPLLPELRELGLQAPYAYGRVFTDMGRSKRNDIACNIKGLTKAGGKLTSISKGIDKAVGYIHSFSPPATMVGNNVVVYNCAYQAGLASVRSLQLELLNKGMPADLVKTISIKNTVIQGICLTYCFKFETTEEAQKYRDCLFKHSEMVIDDAEKRPFGKVKASGKSDSYTFYINNIDGKTVRIYIKLKPHRDEYFNIADPQIAKEMRELGTQIIRVEIELSQKYLEQNNLHDPQSWKGRRKAEIIYRRELNWLRSILKLTTKYRTNDPQEGHLKKLADSDRAMVESHIAGKDIMALRKSNKETWKYEPVRTRILKGINIDINVPWAVQKVKAGSKKTNRWLRWDNIYKVPKHLQSHCYIFSTAKKKNAQLRALVKQAMRS